MNIRELKEKLPVAVERWAEERIDALATERPEMAVAATYMKRGARNIVAAYGGRMAGHLDAAALFLADKDGNVDAETVLEDAVQMLKVMPETAFKVGVLDGSIGGGRIRIGLPDNILSTLLLGERKTIAFGEEDIRMLAEYVKGGEVEEEP